MYKYSVIIPHYNIPELLQRCLDSIPERDDVQVIVVDDNSDSSKVDFEKFPGLKRPNTEVYFTKEGRGAGYARNVGLKYVKGEWILFADSDDVFLPEINDVLKALEATDSDIVYFDVISKDSETGALTDEANYFNKAIVEGIEKNVDSIRFSMEVPWCKAIKKAFLDRYKIKFEEIPCSNDTRFSILCGYYAKKISVLRIVAYCWMTRAGSLWRKRDTTWAKTRLMVQIRLAEFFKRERNRERIVTHDRMAKYFLTILNGMSRKDFFLYYAIYAIRLHHFNILFIKIPRMLVDELRVKIGIGCYLRKILVGTFLLR